MFTSNEVLNLASVLESQIQNEAIAERDSRTSYNDYCEIRKKREAMVAQLVAEGKANVINQIISELLTKYNPC